MSVCLIKFRVVSSDSKQAENSAWISSFIIWGGLIGQTGNYSFFVMSVIARSLYLFSPYSVRTTISQNMLILLLQYGINLLVIPAFFGPLVSVGSVVCIWVCLYFYPSICLEVFLELAH